MAAPEAQLQNSKAENTSWNSIFSPNAGLRPLDMKVMKVSSYISTGIGLLVSFLDKLDIASDPQESMQLLQ